MKYFVGFVIWSLTLFTRTRQEDLKVAIIGGGIGGTSCAYFLRQMFEETIKIDLYEGGEIGGRLATVKMNNGFEYETGGAIIHNRNKYMNEFAETFLLMKRGPESYSPLVGVYNGSSFDFVGDKSPVINVMKIVWRYGLNVKRLQNFVCQFLSRIDKIYQLQTNGHCYESIDTLLRAMDTKFEKYLNVTVKETYTNAQQLTMPIIRELVQASVKINYGQNINVHTFAGSISMTGMDGSLWAVKGGNKVIAQKLLASSKANLIRSYVARVVKNHDSFDLYTNTEKSGTYDYVVYAAPLARNQKVPIFFKDMHVKRTGKYHRTVSTIVIGKLSRTRFPQVYDNTTAVSVVSDSDTEYFNSITNVENLDAQSDLNVWRIMSNAPLEQTQLDELFDTIEEVQVQDWTAAYPRYRVPTEWQSFILDEKIYHINAIEWAASAMEMICIGSKNVALLIQKHFRESQEPS